MNPTVELFTVTELKRNIPAEFKHLAPATNEFAIRIVLKGVNAPIANAIRRVIANELPFKYLECTSFQTNDTNILQEFIENRIQMIPIKQSATIGTEYTLKHTNNSTVIENVNTNFGAPCPTNIILCTLYPQRQLLAKMVVREAYAFHNKMSSIGVISNAVSLPYKYAEATNSSTFSHPDYEIKAISNGTIDSGNLLEIACANIISRLERIKIITENLKVDTNKCEILVTNETATMSTMIVKQLLTRNPTIKFASKTDQTDNDTIKLIVHTDSPYTEVANACADLIAIFAKIGAQLKAVIVRN